MIQDKKAKFGIEIVSTVLMSLFILALFAIAIFAGANSLNNSSLFTTLSGSVINESVTPVSAGTSLSVAGLSGVVCTITSVRNDSQASTINPNNYTVISPCKIANLTSEFTDSPWNVTYTYTYNSNGKADTSSVLNNLTSGTTSFFSNIPTFMSILVIVVIFIFLGLMIGAITYLAVRRKERTGM
jgi:hypothetical protein